MNDLLNVLRLIPRPARWLTTFFLLAAMAYGVGRLLKLGNRSWILVTIVLVCCVVYGLIELVRGRREKKKSRDFEGKLGLQSRRGGEAGKEDIREAVAELSEKWQTAVSELRTRGQSVYELPWYLLIGEPQSGKSTTLRNSGLEFPIGADALSGAGGTRNCDWWFTDEAIILDTAGRFTFQEEGAPDQHEWEAFLRLLRKNRRYSPINGAILVIPATSLVEDTPEEQEKKAKNIRQKLLHLQKFLEIRFPVFVLVTKADRILGFTEFFSKLDPAGQRQLFGWSNPGPPEEGWKLDSFDGIFDEIVDRVHRRRLRFLKDEDDPRLVDKLFVFPEELAAIRQPLANYLHTIFKSSRFEDPFLFRGFYLTSGVQQGRPIAVACRDLLRVQFGDPQGVLEDLEQVFSSSRAFFIRDFYVKKLFPEKGLIGWTRAAKLKDQRYRWAMYGLGGALGLTTLLLLLFGGINLFRVVSPIQQSAEKAGGCLSRSAPQPCEIPAAYDLIQGFENHKRNVREAKWTMRAFLKSGDRNEISSTLIPRIQAQLFRQNVLEPLLGTFAVRAQSLSWDGHAKDYDSFYGGFKNLLRFQRLAGATASDDVAKLQQELRIKPFLDFARATPKGDPQGAALDAWLQENVNLDQADKIFQEAMGAKPDLTGLSVPESAGSHSAFRNYWTVRNVARWDALTDEYLRTYQTLADEMLGLTAPAVPAPELSPFALTAVSPGAPPAAAQPAPAAPGYPAAPGDPAAPAPAPQAAMASATLARFAELAQRFDKNYTDGATHMASPRQAPGASRPGPDPKAWEANCRTDYEALLQISPIARREDVAAWCRTIPVNYNRLLQARQQYLHLYQIQAAQPGGAAVMAWSADAARLKDPLVALGAVASPQQVQADAAALQVEISQKTGAEGRLDAIRQAWQRHSQTALAPVAALAALSGAMPVPMADPAAAPMPGAAPAPAPAQTLNPIFRLPQGLPRAREIAATAAVLRVLPPASTFFSSEQAFGCMTCFNPKHADDHVLLANELLQRSREALQPEVAPLAGQLSTAEFNYLDSYINQQRFGGGGGGWSGGGGASFQVPGRAGQAGSWRDFVRALRSWEPVIERPAGGGGMPVATVSAGGLTEDALARYASGNDALYPLLDRFRERGQRAAASAAAAARPAKPPAQELVDAAEAFKSCVAGMEENPLAAWRQLVRGENGVSLAGFHAFSTNLRLRGNPSAASMINIETKGAQLLVREIRPQFDSRLRGLWTIAGSCCNDRFPFISRARLQGQQESYQAGPSAGGPWAPPGRDSQARSVTNVLQLDTVTLDALDRLFFAGGSLDSLFEEFAIDPIVDGREKAIDFVGANKERLRVLRQWQRFIYGDGRTSAAQKFQVKLLSGASTGSRIFVGERMGQLELFGPRNAVRPSTDAGRERALPMPLVLDDRTSSVVGRNEDKTGGWSGILTLRGGPLKVPYFVHLASQGRPREGGKVWTVRLQLPDYTQTQQRLEGVFEITFERPLPEIVPGAALDAP